MSNPCNFQQQQLHQSFQQLYQSFQGPFRMHSMILFSNFTPNSMSIIAQAARSGCRLPLGALSHSLSFSSLCVQTHVSSSSSWLLSQIKIIWPSTQAVSARAASSSAAAPSSIASSPHHHHHHHHQQQQQQSIFVLPMPSLSHAMTSGRISKWLKGPGELVSIYDVIAEVTTDSLVDEAYKVDDFAGSVTLLLESQEEAYLAAVLVPEGQDVRIGTPVAVLCEDQGEVHAAAQTAQQLASLDVYDEAAMQRQQRGGPKLKLLEWQSYLKESAKDSGSSCGCM